MTLAKARAYKHKDVSGKSGVAALISIFSLSNNIVGARYIVPLRHI
jgi:hypothetical protein